MEHHALALEAPLYGMESWLVELWRRRGLNELKGKGSLGTYIGIIMIGREGVF